MIVTHHNIISYKYLDYKNYKYISSDKHPHYLHNLAVPSKLPVARYGADG